MGYYCCSVTIFVHPIVQWCETSFPRSPPINWINACPWVTGKITRFDGYIRIWTAAVPDFNRNILNRNMNISLVDFWRFISIFTRNSIQKLHKSAIFSHHFPEKRPIKSSVFPRNARLQLDLGQRLWSDPHMFFGRKTTNSKGQDSTKQNGDFTEENQGKMVVFSGRSWGSHEISPNICEPRKVLCIYYAYIYIYIYIYTPCYPLLIYI